MKNIVLLIVLAAFMLASCGGEKKADDKTPATEQKEMKEEVNALVGVGEKLFTEKTCVTCHLKDSKVIGPSILDINKIYEEQSGDVVKFLKGESKPIVDTVAAQVAVMQANIDGFVKDLTDGELKALAAYMKSVK